MAHLPAGPLAAYLGVRNENEMADQRGIGLLAKLQAVKDEGLRRGDELQFRKEQGAANRDLARETRDANLAMRREATEAALAQRQQSLDMTRQFQEARIAAIGDDNERKREQTAWQRNFQIQQLALQREIAATRAAQAEVGKALPTPLMKDLIEKGQILDSSERFVKGFKDDYGGYMSDAAGKLSLQVERKNPLSTRTDRTQWWQDYELHQSVVRNKLFGSALTAPEIQAWEQSAITPGMTPANIRENLKRREGIERDGMIKLARASATQYNRKAIEEALGRPIPDAPSAAPAPAAPAPAAPGGWSIRPAP